MGLARDIVIASKNTSTVFIALLSASLHEALDAKGKRFTEIPHMEWDISSKTWSSSPGAKQRFGSYTAFGENDFKTLPEALGHGVQQKWIWWHGAHHAQHP